MTQGPYSRVYHSIIDDPQFAEVLADKAAFGTWVRLLMIGDAAFPSSAPIPRGIKKAPLKLLVDVGLVELLPGDLYRIRGMTKEREQRSASASANAQLRWSRPREDGGRPASRGTRFKVLERDGFKCRYCGSSAPDVVLDVDHVVPVREGGTDALDNLVAACVDCNSGKSGHPLRAQVPADARSLPADARASGTHMLRREEKNKDKTSNAEGANAPEQPARPDPLTEEQRDTLLQENLRLMNDPKAPGPVRRAAERTVALLRNERKSA